MKLEERVGLRAMHVVSENNRTEATAKLLLENDLESAGKLLVESHENLRDLYEVSSPALNQIVESALEIPGCLGARMTGAGFGGCAVALITNESASFFIDEIQNRYFRKSGLTANVYLTSATNGAETLLLQ